MSADSRNDTHKQMVRRAESGRARGTSQQRLGILRNPNRAPLPPPRRAALMGKWPSLRSSRRAQPAAEASLPDGDEVPRGPPAACADQLADPTPDAGATARPLLQRRQPRLRVSRNDAPKAAEGTAGTDNAPGNPMPAEPSTGKPASRIDIVRLMAEAEDIVERKPGRSRYGEAILPTVDETMAERGKNAPDSAEPRRKKNGETAPAAAHVADAGESAASPPETEQRFPPLDESEPEMPPAMSAEEPSAKDSAAPGSRRRVIMWSILGLVLLVVIIHGVG